MKNYTTRYFCRKFRACTPGMRFALKFKTMRDCYAALLAGEAGERSTAWAIWTATREGVMSDRDLRLFAVRCARRVQHLMKDERSIDALDVAERYAKGEATEDEMAAARDAARDAAVAAPYAPYAADAAARNAAVAAARDAAVVAAVVAAAYAPYIAVWNASYDAERREQLKILAEFGNPFKEN